MTNLPSILLIDDEVGFQEAFAESLKTEIKQELFQLELASSGQEGLAVIENNNRQNKETFVFIDIILPDVLGTELINIIARKNIDVKGILISAHKSSRELEEIRSKYNWIVDSISKPINREKLKNTLDLLVNSPSLSKFDYKTLDQTTAKFLLQETENIRNLMKRTAEGIIETGERLKKVKKKLQYGQFMAWLESDIGCHYTTALHFMRVWETFGNQKEEIIETGIAASLLYLLSAPSMPKQLRTEIVEKAKAGTLISFTEAKRLKKEYVKHQNNVTKKDITTIDLDVNSSSSQMETSQPKINHQEQRIVKIVPKAKPKAKFWSLGDHLLYCGSPQDPEFCLRLPKNISLNIGFPSSQSWSKATLFPVESSSTFIFHSVFEDLDLAVLTDNVKKIIETYTDNKEAILFSGLPNPKMLLVADRLNCQCFIVDDRLEQCQNIVVLWEATRSKNLNK